MPSSKPNVPLTLTPPEKQWDEVYQRIGWWDSDTIAQAWVLVVGAGALGNEALKNLALLGVANIVLLDFDDIEYSNLSRSVLFREADCGLSKSEVAARRVREINPSVNIIPLHGDVIYDLGIGLIRRMDVVIGCLDNRIARLYINRHCYKAGKIWVDGGIENLAGRMDVFIPNETCYECQLSEREWDVILHRMSCTDVAQRNANFGRIATTPISSSIIAAMQVQEAMKVIFSNDKNLLRGQRFFMEGMSNEIMFYSSHKLKDDCQSHISYDDIIESDLSNNMPLEEVLSKLEQLLAAQEVKIILNYRIAFELVTRKSEKTIPIIIAVPKLSNELINRYEEIPGEGLVTLPGKTTNELTRAFPDLKRTLAQLAIPPLQVLEVETPTNVYLVELTADLEHFPGLKIKKSKIKNDK